MNIVITGANGFIGKNLSIRLQEIDVGNIIELNRKTPDIKQEEAFREADFIFHLAGANRPKNQEDFYLDNVDYTERILSILRKKKKSLIFYLAQQYRQKKALIMGLVKQLQKKK